MTSFEHARHYLDTQRLKGKTIDEVRKNQGEFQLGVLDMQIEQENQISPDVLVFFDRAIPDAQYLPPKQWYYKILSFFFANWYCNWCLNNMLNDTKRNLKNKTSVQAKGGVQV